MTSDCDAGSLVSLQPLHRPQSGFEATIVGFNAVVRVLRGVVERERQKFGDRSSQGW